MKPITVSQLVHVVGGTFLSRPVADRTFTAVSTDSRTTRSGDCFFAIKGDRFDGHDYVTAAFERGAVCAVVERPVVGVMDSDRVIVCVPDATQALGDLAREYRRQHRFKVAAITGSVGKTTTRQIMAHVLGQHLRIWQSPKNFNNFLGLPLTLLGAEPDRQVIVAELGTNRMGEIEYLTRIALPNVAIVTGVYPAHLEGFGTLEALRAEKLSIADGLLPGGTFVVNADQPGLLEQARAKHRRVIGFGLTERADVRAQDVRHHDRGSDFRIDGIPIAIGLLGPGNVLNACAAAAACRTLGVPIEAFAQAVTSVAAVAMRAEPLQLGSLTVINDCYNANPASMTNALEILKSMAGGTGRRRVFICGDMGELGDQAEAFHRQLGEQIGQSGVEVLLAVGRWAEQVAGAARQANDRVQAACFNDAFCACQALPDAVRRGDIVLIKGSRSVRLEQVLEPLEAWAARDRDTGAHGING
jgi:UDP-N-acetylmuramoyl-tripeptide--D-alanyl-D-alanine ligase